ncbi:MAG: MFS transporter [Acidobacteriota bacterium]
MASRLPLFLAGASLGATGHIVAVTISAIAAERMTGNAALAGAPVAASVLGTAAGSSLWSAVLARRGQAFTLRLAYAVGATGGLLALWATFVQSLPLLVLGLFVTGTGNGATQLTRYLAADLFPEASRGRALSMVVWMGTVGAVAGPMLMEPTARWASALGAPETAGAYATSSALFLLNGALYLLGLRDRETAAPTASQAERPAARRFSLLSYPAARIALVCLVTGHVSMVFVMTMTPIHLQHQQHGLGIVGWVISGHILGMFALSPVVGWLVDRFGPRSVLAAGLTVLASATLLAASRPESLPALGIALYVLGLGWNLGFVAGSALLNESLPEPERAVQRGFGDAVVWIAAALASFTSSLVYEATSFATLSLLALALTSLALGSLVVLRPRTAAA